MVQSGQGGAGRATRAQRTSSRGHHENLYDLPDEVGHAVWDLTRQVAAAMREACDCAGISTRQHNEPAGGQDVWHLHVHVFQRYDDDRLDERHGENRWASPEERDAVRRPAAPPLLGLPGTCG